MNFPNLPGSNLQPSCDSDELDSLEIDRRLAALAEAEIVPVRPEWLEATVARAAAARPGSRRAGPFRRLLVAAAAMLGVHGMLAAATVASVGAGVVVAVVVWTAGRNSNETMSYAMALEILRRGDQPEEHRLAAMTQVVARVRATITVLGKVRDDPNSPSELVAVCRAALDRLRAGRWGTGLDPGVDPIDQFADLLAGSRGLDERLAVAQRCAMAAEVGWSTMATAPSASAQFDEGRATLLRRLSRLLGG
ncbi:MAG: hypothetical protein JNL12_17670 [Planctomycetes bacterium]|nr:hypothetical protein [Planctomycetota bacterium]